MIETIDTALTEEFRRIDEHRALPANWDGEDALPVDDAIASRARLLLQAVAETAARRQVR